MLRRGLGAGSAPKRNPRRASRPRTFDKARWRGFTSLDTIPDVEFVGGVAPNYTGEPPIFLTIIYLTVACLVGTLGYVTVVTMPHWRPIYLAANLLFLLFLGLLALITFPMRRIWYFFILVRRHRREQGVVLPFRISLRKLIPAVICLAVAGTVGGFTYAGRHNMDQSERVQQHSIHRMMVVRDSFVDDVRRRTTETTGRLTQPVGGDRIVFLTEHGDHPYRIGATLDVLVDPQDHSYAERPGRPYNTNAGFIVGTAVTVVFGALALWYLSQGIPVQRLIRDWRRRRHTDAAATTAT